MGIECSMFKKHRCFFKNIDDKIIDGRVSDTSITSMFYVQNIGKIQLCYEQSSESPTLSYFSYFGLRKSRNPTFSPTFSDLSYFFFKMHSFLLLFLQNTVKVCTFFTC